MGAMKDGILEEMENDIRALVGMDNEKNVKSIQRTKKYKDIKADLIDQLERAGNTKEYYLDLVEDYMHLYVTKTMLQKDIDERGARTFYGNGGGQFGFKKNDSIEQILKVNTQMLKILEALKISPEADVDGDDDDF